MIRYRMVALVALLLLLAPLPAGARALSSAEKVALTGAVAAFDKAMRESNYAAVIDGSIPPRVLSNLSGKVGAPIAKFRAFLIAQTRQLMATAKLESFSMDLAKAQHKELKSGQPYVLIPTMTVIDAGQRGKLVQSSFTLANLDGGKWYLLRIANPKQIAMLNESYPEFSGVAFPRGTMEMKKK